MSELKTAKDLQELYEDCMADDSRASRTTTSGSMIELIERIDAAESRVKQLEHRIEGLIDKYEGCPHTVDCGCAQDKPSDICAHHAPQLRKALAENAALKREVSMWRSEHDPCPFSLENETLRAENERLEKQIARFLEPISDEERRVANHRAGIRCWAKDEVESLIANRLEPKGENDGK